MAFLNLKKLFLSITILGLTFPHAFASDSLSYSGRLVNTNGSPVTGLVNLKIDFAYTNATSSILCTQQITNVALTNGVFHIKLDPDCTPSTFTSVLNLIPAGEALAVRVTDETHTKAYSFQALHSMPFSVMSSISKQLIQMGATPGQVLAWNGTTWAPAAPGGGGTVTSIATGSGLTGGPITTTGTISIATGGIVASMINQMGAALGNILKWNGTNWAPAADSGLTSETDPTVQGFAKNNVPICNADQTLKFDALLNAGAGGLFCSTIILDTDDIAEGATNKYFTDARAQAAAVADAINDGTTTIAPSQNAVFDALALKQNNLTLTSDIFVRSLGIGTNLPDAKLDVRSPLASSSGTGYGMVIRPTVDQSGTAGYTGLLMNVVENTTGSGAKKLIDLQVGGVSKFSVDATGAVTSTTSTSGTTATYTNSGGNQLTLGYDGTNKMVTNVDSLGFTTLTANGVSAGFNFTGGNVGIGTPVPGEALDVTGNIRASSSVMAPLLRNASDLTLTADSDNNTSGALIFNTGTNERMRILNNGNVGIGTATPDTKLDVAGDLKVWNVAQSAPWDFTKISSDGTLSHYNAGGAESGIAFEFDAVEKVRFAANGNVGIGTVSPNSKLDIQTIEAAGLVNRSLLQLNHLYNGGVNGQNFQIIGMSTGGTYDGINLVTRWGPRMSFGVANNSASTTPVEQMSITQAGNVGIGTTNPLNKLSVHGSEKQIRIQDTEDATGVWSIGTVAGVSNTSLNFIDDDTNVRMTILETGSVGIGTASPSTTLEVNGAVTVSGSNDLVMKGSAEDAGDLIFRNSSGTQKGRIWSESGVGLTGLYLSSGDNTPDIHIDNAGNVGIGTTAPTSRLHVFGDSNFEGNVTQGGAGKSVTLNDVVSSFGLPAQGTRVAVFNLPISSVCKVSLFSSENNFYQPIELDITRQNSAGSTPLIIRTGKKIHAHSDDIAFSADTNGDVWMEKVDFATGREVTVKKVEIQKGSCAILPGTTTAAGVGADQSVRDTGYFTANSFGIHYLGNVGIGTSSPETKLDVIESGVLGLSDVNSYGFQVRQGSAALAIGGDTNYSYIQSFNSKPLIINNQGNETILNPNSGNVGIGTASPSTKLQVAGEISPSADNSYPLGDSSLRFTAVYAVNGTIQTSDARQKTNIQDSDLGLDFINKLRPVSYNWKSGPDSALHYGLIAQETEKAVLDSRNQNKDVKVPIVDHDEKTDRYGLRYTELISPIIRAVQELYNRIRGIDRDIASIKAKKADKKALEAFKAESDSRVRKLEAENAQLKRKVKEFDAMKAYLCSKDPAAPICK